MNISMYLGTTATGYYTGMRYILGNTIDSCHKKLNALFIWKRKKLLLVGKDLLTTLTAGHTLLLLAAHLTGRQGLLLLNNSLFK